MPQRAYPSKTEQSPVVYVVHGDFSVPASLHRGAPHACWRIESFRESASFLSRLPDSGPACLILNMDLPDIDGLTVQSLLAHRDDIPVIFVTDTSNVRMAVRAMKAGALDVFTTPIDEHSLLGAVRQALQRSSALQFREAERRAVERKYQQLSPREREVMQLVIRGRLNKHIAAEMGIAEITVKTHRAKVMRKMQADSVPHLVTMAAALRIAPERSPEEPAWAISASASRLAGQPAPSQRVAVTA